MDFEKAYRVRPGEKLKLDKIDPEDHGGIEKEEGAFRLDAAKTRLAKLQYQLYAEGRQSLLIILQALDAGGKDGVINQVLSVLNPQGSRVQSFKVPTPLEAAHDFLWRVHAAAPRDGELVIFNRSHYESVLVEKVHEYAPKEVIEARYDFINNFEKLLTFHRTRIVKFFLHISPEEQLERFVERLNDPEKNWKISDSDYREREKWDDYTKAFEDAISRCTTESSPWYVIPSNRKWFRNVAVAEILVKTLEEMNPQIPAPTVNLEEIRTLASEQLAAMKAKKG